MRCPHRGCGSYDTHVTCRFWERRHHGCDYNNCCREEWECLACGRTWEQYTCEG